LGKGNGWIEEVSRQMPLKRMLRPEEVARVALFLLSDMSIPMTGVSLDVEQTVVGSPK
jgi:enoyl-[acyl-carrier-protein] reductase (NADH)